MNLMGIKLNNKRYFHIEFTKIYGIGISISNKFCKKNNIYEKRVFEINFDEKKIINNFLKKNILGIELKKTVFYNIKRLIYINCYRGNRHKKKLPVRGQRTRTNAKTSKRRNNFLI
ncbi:ribosomal protein uS13 [Candidatus Vidania fulgoroideorum]